MPAIQLPRERRSKPRIDVPFHARVQGIDGAGNEFFIETVLDNISSDGLYMRMMPSVEIGSALLIDVGLRPTEHVTPEAPRFSISGVVLRKEDKLGGTSGVAVSFVKVRFP